MNFLAKFLIRTSLTLTSQEKAKKQALQSLENYLILADSISEELGSVPVKVPKMKGVDEDMREWSFYMLLEHNTIVNNSISSLIYQLALDQELSGLSVIDPKKDVMPSTDASRKQVAVFEESVKNHLYLLSELPASLRGTKTVPHPIFGELDAHMWNSMFSLHLNLHYEQAKYIVDNVKLKKGLV